MASFLSKNQEGGKEKRFLFQNCTTKRKSMCEDEPKQGFNIFCKSRNSTAEMVVI